MEANDIIKNYNESIKQQEEQEQEEQEEENIYNIYTCECCDVKFKKSLGFEYNISNGIKDKNGKETGRDDSKLWVVYEQALFNDSWIYFLHKPFATYGDLKSHITNNYNLKHTYPEDESNIWTHLYNKHINPNIPLDAKMYEEYIF
jgi:hypothetical protein